METPAQNAAVFLDRDGTLMEEVCYCADPAQVRVFEGVTEALRALRAAGFRTIVVTNQSGIAKGLITPAAYESVHARLLELLGPRTGEIEILPVRPAPGAVAGRVLVRARKGLRRGPVTLYDGLTLHDVAGGPGTSRAADALRGGALEWK
jgi:HAD superfamily hydrolase (TIGR01662 family)